MVVCSIYCKRYGRSD